MKKFVLIAVFLVVAAVPVAGQDTVTITLEDLRQFRKAVADRDFWQKTAKDQEGQIESLQKSAKNWQTIAASETDRADRVQGSRIEEIRAANTDLKNANQLLHIQGIADRQKIGEQQADIIGLKSSRKWYVLTGLASGAAAGFFGGRQTCGTSIPGLSRAAESNRQLGVKFNF